jgi:hypothetical protein
MKTVKAGREKLQVSPLPPVAIGDQGDTSWAPPAVEAGPEEDVEGFFDQDQA